MQSTEKKQLNETDLFIVFFYAYVQDKTQDPSKGFLSMIFELLKKAQQYIVRRKQDSEAENVYDISLKNDDTL